MSEAQTRDIAIYGAGGYGNEVACLIQRINESAPANAPQWNFVGFFDDGVPAGTRTAYGEVLGGLDALNAFPRALAVAIAIASPKALSTLPQKITNPHVSFPTLIAPGTIFLDRDSVTLGRGNIIGWRSFISCNVTIGDFNIFVGVFSAGHDAQIGNGNAFFPEARLSGHCTVGNANFFGMRTAVLQGVKIGSDTRVGAGAFVMHKTKDGFLYLGNPARRTDF